MGHASALHATIRTTHDLNQLHPIINKNKLSLDDVNEEGATPLLTAVLSENINAITALLRAGASIGGIHHLEDNGGDITAFERAISLDAPHCVAPCLEYIDVHAPLPKRARSRMTPMMKAHHAGARKVMVFFGKHDSRTRTQAQLLSSTLQQQKESSPSNTTSPILRALSDEKARRVSHVSSSERPVASHSKRLYYTARSHSKSEGLSPATLIRRSSQHTFEKFTPAKLLVLPGKIKKLVSVTLLSPQQR